LPPQVEATLETISTKFVTSSSVIELDQIAPRSTSPSDEPVKGPPIFRQKGVRGAISRILQSAARYEERVMATSDDPATEKIVAAPIDKSSILIAVGLTAGGLVRPVDVLSVIFLTGYIVLLTLLASSPASNSRSDDDAPSIGGISSNNSRPALPSLPPQGHVPPLVSNPLGYALTNSNVYRIWLRAGALLGLVGPLTAVIWYKLFQNNFAAASACGRPIFLICCQAVSEALSRRELVS